MKKERIILPTSSFIAFVDFFPEDKRLEFTIRKSGKKYAAKITKKLFDELKKANNKGSFISINIISKIQCNYVEIVPAATIELITLPKSKYYINLAI